MALRTPAVTLLEPVRPALRHRTRCNAAAGGADAGAKELRAAVAAAYAARRGSDSLLALRRSPDTQRLLAAARGAAACDALSLSGLADALWAAGALASGGGGLDGDLDTLSAAFARAALASSPHPAAAADAAWALAVARHSAPATFASLAACARRGDFACAAPRAASTLLWATAVLAPPAERHGDALAAAMMPPGASLRSWRAPHLALTLWALAANDVASSPAFAAAWAALPTAPGEMPPLALTQLAQAALSVPDGLAPLPAALAEAASSAWAARVDGGTRRAVAPPSALQAAVGRGIGLLGHRGSAVGEALAPGGYRVDWAVPPAAPGGPATLLEVDGAAHFARNAPPLAVLAARTAEPPHPLGATRLKRAHLLRGPHPLAVVTHWEWEEATLADCTTDFLRRVVADAEAQFASRADTIGTRL